MGRVLGLLVALLLAALFPAFAADTPKEGRANPSLSANIDGVNDAAMKSGALKIGSMEMAIVVRGSIAETTITARFDNPSSSTLEGNFTLDMPANSLVTGYALDVGGVMIDGVLVPPHAAQVAYEQRVTARVDPGIVEVTRGSQFSTRVFPIFPGSGRTIRLRYVTPFDVTKGYRLPLITPGKVGKFSLSIKANGMAALPTLELPSEINARWKDDGTLSVTANDIAIKGEIGIAMPAISTPVQFSEHPGEGKFFELRDSVTFLGSRAQSPQNVTLFWDRSVSRLDDKLADEIALVSRYLEQVKPSAVKLILFDSGAVEQLDLKPAAVATALRAVRYGGATSFAKLAELKLAPSDVCLLFSDGVSTLDKPDAFKPRCPLFAVTSTRDAERGFLEARANRTGGAFLDLSQRTADELLARMTRSQRSITAVLDDSGNDIDFIQLDGGMSEIRLIGEAPNSGHIRVLFSGGEAERRYPVSSFAAQSFSGPGALWAASRIAGGGSEMSDADKLALARRYSVASPIASFIVLETPNDYAQAGIDPPASYPKASRAQYASMKDALDRAKANAVENRLGSVLAAWNAHKAWWNRKYDPNAKPAAEVLRKSRESENATDAATNAVDASAGAVRPPPAISAPPPPPPPAPPASAPEPVSEGEGANEAIIVTATRRQENLQNVPIAVTSVSGDDVRPRRPRRDRAEAAAAPAGNFAQASGGARPEREEAKITLQPWSSDRPYIAAYDAAGANFDKVFLVQEKKHGVLPVFYLDTAEWLFSKGRSAEAARMVSAALELPTRNNNTLAIVAARLLRYGEADRAIGLLEQLVTLEPERPQPRRTLALALLNRAKGKAADIARPDMQRALDLLTEVIMTPWEGQYGGIETIALMEANAIIPRLRALNGTTGQAKVVLDPQLITLLDTDLRVTVEWNTKATDMDLWIDEPSKERVIYNHPLSARGGKLSRDMTQGFGPEEYLLRRAGAGVYAVRVNTFATDRLNPNGATVVTARLIRNFGRENEREELIDIEVLPGQSGERLIGRIEVK
jgi:tetratricopeptide (TPR) repeat protein